SVKNEPILPAPNIRILISLLSVDNLHLLADALLVKIIVPKDPSKDGYTFKGWNPEVPERMPDHDLVFEAQFARTGADVIDDVPATGSAAAGLAVFAVISGACAAAYVMNKKKKEF
ncbi:MAG: hypothetical protein II702_06130, partial [Clostridia bacterium]|nr:hypothetical protein [Clostridia bacterium]